MKKKTSKITTNEDPSCAINRLKQRIALKKLEIDKKSINNDRVVDKRDWDRLQELEKELDQMVKNMERD